MAALRALACSRVRSELLGETDAPDCAAELDVGVLAVFQVVFCEVAEAEFVLFWFVNDDIHPPSAIDVRSGRKIFISGR